MAQDYRVLHVPATSTLEAVADELQGAADEGFRWIDTIPADGATFVVMECRRYEDSSFEEQDDL